jgi:phospholipid/cholesterol/gamma-HCH transport system permease protein
MAIPFGVIVSTQVGNIVSQLGADSMIGAAGGLGVIKQGAPMAAAMMLGGAGSAAIASDLGARTEREEVDAMRVMGIDPYEALVLPRVVALVIMTPLVTFIGILAGMIGGALAIWGSLGLGPAFFVQRLYDYVPTVNLFVGMIRTPVFAVTIAIVGCRLGMTVKDDVISLGRQVTTAVVQSIFLIFMIDAVFAVLFNGFVF